MPNRPHNLQQKNKSTVGQTEDDRNPEIMLGLVFIEITRNDCFDASIRISLTKCKTIPWLQCSLIQPPRHSWCFIARVSVHVRPITQVSIAINGKVFGHLIGGKRTAYAEVTKNQARNTESEAGDQAHKRILIMCSLSLSEWVLITYSSHQIFQSCDPGASFLWVRCNQIQGLHVVAVVNGKATAWVKVPLCMAVEDFRLPAFGDFVNGIDDNYGEKGEQKMTCLDIHPTFFCF